MTSRREDLVFLDLVRGLSAQAVVVGHALIFAFPDFWAEPLEAGRVGARADFFYVQSYAVVAFLALSGFLVTMSVARRLRLGTFTFSGYVKDRSARIFVPLLPAIPVILIVDRFVLGSDLYSRFVVVRHDWWTVVGNALMLQDNAVLKLMERVLDVQLAVRAVGTAAPWWTVAYEWWIYVAFAAITSLLVARRRRCHPTMLILALFSGASVLGLLASGNGLALAWMTGFAFAWWQTTLVRISPIRWAQATAVAVLIVISWLVWRPSGYYDPVVAVATGVALFSAFHLVPQLAMQTVARPVAVVADYSYSLYLMHFPILVWLAALCDLSGIEFLVTGVICSNVLSWCWWLAFERHYPIVRRWLGGYAHARPE